MTKRSKKKPEEKLRRFFINRRTAYFFSKPFALWTNYNEVSINVGTPLNKYHGFEVPEAAWTIGFRLWPFRLIVHKHLKQVL